MTLASMELKWCMRTNSKIFRAPVPHNALPMMLTLRAMIIWNSVERGGEGTNPTRVSFTEGTDICPHTSALKVLPEGQGILLGTRCPGRKVQPEVLVEFVSLGPAANAEACRSIRA